MRRLFAPALAALATACGAADPSVVSSGTDLQGGTPVSGKADSSAEAVFLDFEFDASFLASGCWNPEGQIEDHLLFTIGHFNGEGGVGRIDRLSLTNVEAKSESGGCRISYHGRMPVAWPKSRPVPKTYVLNLPSDMTYAAKDAFAKKYTRCLDPQAHDVTTGSYWYYYRPKASGCKLEDADVIRAEANVFPSAIQTTGKYPEFHQVWEDGRLEVVAIFGKYEDGATSGDAGIDAYDRFSQQVKQVATKFDPAFSMEPANLPFKPGVANPSFSVTANLPGDRVLQIKAFLIDNVQQAPESFWDQYEALTPSADFIVYNGHAGLGANVRKLAAKGKWVTGQYAIVFMNGCDTYAYVDDALAQAHAAVNPNDPEGTLHLDLVANAMPSFFSSMSAATMAMVNGLLEWERPKTYEQIFENIDDSEVVLVTGEHDNVFVPGYSEDAPPITPVTWNGLDEKGSVKKGESVHFETPVLDAGRYEFVMTGSGDADLYARIGSAATEADYDCRPYADGSDETCEVTLGSPTAIHLMVSGYADATFELVGTRM